MFYNLRLSYLSAVILLLFSNLLSSAEILEPVTEPVKEPIEITPEDTVESGEAEHAFKKANPCEGMTAEGFLGTEACVGCHQDKIATMHSSPHGRKADPRSPFARQGCETCHGPGVSHFDAKGNCMISLTGRYGESVKLRNDVCLGCHKGGPRKHWASSIHEAEDMVCDNCHSIHSRNDVIHRESQTEVCFACHKNIRAQTFRASSHPIANNRVICSDCHNP
ncbi:MAG: multiheme c-type cytochrome, partial [Gammaproteobacteria bacterium]|nr:multiheme c-type cytochrome [Gammaproteobacteria bacterium]